MRNWWYQRSVNPLSGNVGSAESLNEKNEQDDDRGVEEDDDEREEGSEEPRAASREGDVHQSAATWRGWRKREKTSGERTDDAEQEQRQHGAGAPVGEAGAEEIDDLVAVHVAGRCRPTRDGVTNSPSVGMNTNRKAAKTPGSGQRQGHADERLPAARSEVGRGLEQSPIEGLERHEDRQRDEGKPDVAQHEHDGELRVDQRRERMVGRA